MIVRVWSSLTGFRSMEFRPGFNVVLADRTVDADETESTNGLGKTTLLRVIHFCLGSDLSKDRVLSHPGLVDVTFGIALTVGSTLVSAVRNTAEPEIVTVTRNAPEAEVDWAFSERIALTDWKTLLTSWFYGASVAKNKEAPKFRDLARYLIRVGKDAYMDPQVSFRQQSGASRRLCTSFLLILNWELQANLQADLGHREDTKTASNALAAFDKSNKSPSIGDLEADRVAIESAIQHKRAELDQFNVREDYKDLEERLERLDRELHDELNANFSDSRLMDFYQQSSVELPSEDPNRAIEVLAEAGAYFSDEGLRQLDEVAEFHKAVYRNRREFIKSEVRRLSEVVSTRGKRIAQLSDDKSAILRTLKSSGAIDTLVELQHAFTQLVAERQALITLLEQRRGFQRREDELSESITRTRSVLRSDLRDRQQLLDEARALFAEYTEALYGRPGRLSVDVAREGYSFSFSIERRGSDGIDQMVVFCFDLAVATLWARRREGFPVLIHDSAMFADVDPRQYRTALELASAESERHGFQYVCCLNTGSLPEDISGKLNLQASIRSRLHDRGPQGKLLGIDLPPPDTVARKKRQSATRLKK